MKAVNFPLEKEQITALFQQGLLLHQQNKLQEAQAIYKKILVKQPHHFDALALLGLIAGQTRQYTVAIEFLSKALQINAKHAETYFNRGIALKELGRFDEALVDYDHSIRINPNYFMVYSNRGNVLQELKRYDEALVSYELAISIKPDYAEAYYNRGIVLKELKRFDEALVSYGLALGMNPNFAQAFNNQGLVLHELRQFDEAIASYDRAIGIKSDYLEAYNNRGNALLEVKNFDAAIISYDLAIGIKPDYAEAYYNRGNALRELRHFDAAISSYDLAIRIKPDYAEAYYNRGIVLRELNRLDEAFASYDASNRIKPSYDFLIGDIQLLKMLMCDWANYDGQRLLIAQKIINNIRVSDPFSALAIIDDPSIHRICCEIFLKDSFPSNKTLGPISKSSRKNKIRIGYFSADFYNHATAYLMAEFFELHDKSQFEIVAFSFGFIQEDEMRTRLKNAFDIFIDVSDQSDESVAKLSRELKIDIAVDLKGLTANSRTGIFSYRAAPIQVNYLGYPGSMAADYMDYIIADYNLIPVKSQKFYSEKIIYLPDSYQVNDRKRIISKKKFTKSELGLPEDGFIFCCFNNNYKITPHTFDSWMRILNTVERSVLWLLQGNEWAVDNLKKEAQKRGVDENRLVFAKIFPLDEHLVRHSQADLFLDTFPCNAHTTASDALWAGLPVLTRMGESFASRVAASLLNAIALPELITSSQEHYEALAIELASHPTKLNAIKMKLDSNRLSTPLFDTSNYTKNLERAYLQIMNGYWLDLPADHFYIEKNS